MTKNQKKNKFTSVDVWRPEFGSLSIKAVYELYRLHSGCTHEVFRATKFRDMVNFLRRLDDPTYEPVKLPINNG